MCGPAGRAGKAAAALSWHVAALCCGVYRSCGPNVEICVPPHPGRELLEAVINAHLNRLLGWLHHSQCWKNHDCLTCRELLEAVINAHLANTGSPHRTGEHRPYTKPAGRSGQGTGCV